MMNQKRNILVALIMFSLFFSATMLGGCGMFEKVYVKDYYEEMGRPIQYLSYSDAVLFWGEPLEVKKMMNGDTAEADIVYNDFIIHLSALKEYSQNIEDYEEMYMEIISDKYEFGKKKIKVGSTKNEVIRAYKWISKIKESEVGEGYVDGTTYIYFLYDLNDRVSSIEIVPLGP